MNQHIQADDISLNFLKEDAADDLQEKIQGPPFLILIVDDEDEVHRITKFVLKNVIVDHHALTFHSVYTGADAISFLKAHTEVAIVLLDVVMETDEAGFEVVRFIRDEQKNHRVRIILRTGQPGMAPEESVIIKYDINDYKSKTELTSQKLFTSIFTCLRGFQDIRRIEENKNGLKKIIESTGSLFRFHNLDLQEFLNGILIQLAALNRSPDALILLNKTIENDRLVENPKGEPLQVIAATGKYTAYVGKPFPISEVHKDFQELASRNLPEGTIFVPQDKHFIGYHKREGSVESFIVLVNKEGDEEQTELVEIFINNLTLALDNFLLYQDTDRVQREIIAKLSEIVEERDSVTANHARRVSEACGLIAEACGLDRHSIEQFKLASMMHDIGKIGILDTITLNPDRLSEEEFNAMKKHTTIGARLLGSSELAVLKTAAIIAESHHENWDGSGYPSGLSGEEIPFLARITSLIDVFDALTHKRIYKEAWTHEKAFEFIELHANKKFDPKLTAVFLSKKEEILKIMQLYED